MCGELTCKAKHVNALGVNTIYLTRLLLFQDDWCLHTQVYLLNRFRGLTLPPFYPFQSSNYLWALLYYDMQLKKMTFLPQNVSSSVKLYMTGQLDTCINNRVRCPTSTEHGIRNTERQYAILSLAGSQNLCQTMKKSIC